MPHGKGTYGSKVGRPAKKSPMNKNGDPKKKKSVKTDMPSIDVKAEDRKARDSRAMMRETKGNLHRREKAPYSKTKRKEHVPQTARDKKPNFEAKTRPDTDRAQRGPRSEGKRGKGTGFAN
tara:strand:+ start:1348 stop:1710 length:363 start_codon:yes stop_codon:yes gene_type:complete